MSASLSDRRPADRLPSHRRPIDWRGWLALGWASWFGLAYGRMVLVERAPGLLRVICRFFDP